MQMHREAREFVSHCATAEPVRVIEIGSLNVNGTIRDLFPNASWIGLDRIAGPCVDVVCDAAQFVPQSPVDVVICCEVFEHADNWQRLIESAYQWLSPGGVFVMTCAGLGRQPHSCDGGGLKPDEYYRNLSPVEIREAIRKAGFRWQITRQVQTDIQSFAVR
jgi:SAM-dependent methyltransferase